MNETDLPQIIASPLSFVRNSPEFFKTAFPQASGIPSVNQFGLELPHQSLVSWDCFVQDNGLSFEIYPESTMAVNAETGQRVIPIYIVAT